MNNYLTASINGRSLEDSDIRISDPSVSGLCHNLRILPVEGIPDTFIEPIRKVAANHIKRNALPKIEDCPYVIDHAVIINRVANQVKAALDNGLCVSPTFESINSLVSARGDFQYSVMLSTAEERAMISVYQEMGKTADTTDILRIASSFLIPRLKPIFARKFAVLTARQIEDDAIQDMYTTLHKLLCKFDLSRTTAGLTPQYINLALGRSLTKAIVDDNDFRADADTWAKVLSFAGVYEKSKELSSCPQFSGLSDEKLAELFDVEEKEAPLLRMLAFGTGNYRKEMGRLYNAAKGTVDLMIQYVKNGTTFSSIDEPRRADGDEGDETLGDTIESTERPYDDLNLDMMLKSILSDVQYDLVKLRAEVGLTHSEITECLNRKYGTHSNQDYYEWEYAKAKKIIAGELKEPGLLRLRATKKKSGVVA